MKIKGFGTISKKEIEIFERETGFIFPDDYRIFLEENNGGEPQEQENYISLEGTEEKIMLNVLFGIGDELKKDFNIVTWLKEFKKELPKTVIVIGVPEGGGVLLLSISEKKKGIFFWDNTFELENSDEWNCMYKIADTFTEFIEKIEF